MNLKKIKEIENDILKIDTTKDIQSIKLLEKIQNFLDMENLSLEEKNFLEDIKNSILEFLIKKTNLFEISFKKEKDFDEGFFVSSLEQLVPPYDIHEHYHIDNDIIKLTEWYYTDIYGKKYRRLIFPEYNKDNLSLLEETFVSERRINLEKIKEDPLKFEI